MADPAPRPRFSLVTAVYDVARYLDEFLGSILAQDFDLGRVEVIAVDDGSTDSSPDILREYADCDARVRSSGKEVLITLVDHLYAMALAQEGTS